ncbi:LysR family transcriptional regulator [Dialister micraerophilus]|uniref:LysR family transcriptional regulator n=1 Tax=Dialister micraerophilus TaxID=309120 RepID=UPI0023F001A3|nr:LysR family transcriptional regulator [Dialister micraerophilus]
MNNTDWKILIYLREERSINKVAKRLFMTQPSLTYRLSQMEKEIGCPLFIRTNKGVHFTDAGNRLYSFAEKELQQYQDMKNYVTHEPNSISGVLRIGASESFAQSYIPKILKGFLSNYNDVEISLTTDTSDHLVKLLKKEDIHLAIVRGNQDWPDTDILLEDAPLYLISAHTIDYKTLIKEPAIRYRSDPSLDEIRDKWWRHNFSDSPQSMLTVSDCFTCVEIVNQGLGYSLVPADILPKCMPHINREPVYDNHHRPLMRPSHLLYKQAMTQSTPVKIFINYVKKYFEV